MKTSVKKISGIGLAILMLISIVYSLSRLGNKNVSSIAQTFTMGSDKNIISVFSGKEPNTIYVHLRIDEYQIKNAERNAANTKVGEKRIEMKNYNQEQSPGNPLLVYLQKDIALPPATIQKSIKVEVLQKIEEELKGEYHIAPVPPMILDTLNTKTRKERLKWEITRWGIDKNIQEGRNADIYTKDEYYPSKYYDVEARGQLRKWIGASILFYPIRYNPVKSKLLLTKELVLKVTFDKDKDYLKKGNALRLLRDNSMDAEAKRLFINYNQAEKCYQNSISKNKALQTIDPNYAIITTDNIFSNSTALQTFCFHKQDMGYTVMVVTENNTHTVTGASGGYSFTDAPGGYDGVVGDYPNQRDEKIRKWLQDNYLLLGIKYVLLIGNPDPDNTETADLVGDIPMQLCWTSIVDDYPTDFYYADLTGNWNVDNDLYAGESYGFTNPITGCSSSTLPAGVTGTSFSARWEGVISIEGAVAPTYLYVEGYNDGQCTVWLDKDNDGFTDADRIVNDPSEHITDYFSGYLTNLANGNYPVKIEYVQSSLDAYFVLYLFAGAGTAVFKHDDGSGTFINDIHASYFNNTTFSGAAAVERYETNLRVIYIIGGDRGLGGVDFYPEVIVGRIPFYGEDENADGLPDYSIVDGILNKTISYENANVRTEKWRRRLLFTSPFMYDYNPSVPGYDTSDFIVGEYMRNNIAKPPFWEWFRIHDKDYGVGAEAIGCSSNQTLSAWNDAADPNDGRGVVMWRTHGSQTGASHVFDASQCPSLDNTKPSIVIQTTCQNGHPEAELYSGTYHYPLGYSLLKNGAVATFSATRNSAGGLFDSTSINIAHKNNPYLMYFFAKGIFDNAKVGDVMFHVKEANASSGSSWGQEYNYNVYGDPTVSLFGMNPKMNNDVVLLLDGSGSMLDENKWNAAKDASVLFYDLLKALRHPAFKDRYGAVVFRWPCSGVTDNTTAIPSGTKLKDIAVPFNLATLAGYTPDWNYCTPIGSGLDTAINQFALPSEASFYSNKTILLLSDGMQNRGNDPLSIDIPDDIKVQAVGLGEDYIQPETISDIASASGGDYRITPTPRVLEDYFVQILCNTSWKLQNLPVAGTLVTIDQNIASFIVAWDNPSDVISFELDPPGALPNITPTNLSGYAPMEVTYHAPAAGETHAFYTCKNIPDALLGEWSFANINNLGVPFPLGSVLLKVVEDPRVIADYNIEGANSSTGNPIILTAKVTEDGSPKVNLVDVYATLISSPNYSAGDLIARNPLSAQKIKEILSKKDGNTKSLYIKEVMSQLAIKSLMNTDSHKVLLKDDGLGYDLKANDGIYTGAYTQTDKEGSYTFSFYTSGKNSANKSFTRSETLSEYLSFNASASQSVVKVIDKVTQGGIATTTIKVIPKDNSGRYLGPFQGHSIKLNANAGVFEKEFIDNLDGSYIFTLRHSATVKPNIIATVNKMVIKPNLVAKVQFIDSISKTVTTLLILLLAIIGYLYRVYREKA